MIQAISHAAVATPLEPCKVAMSDVVNRRPYQSMMYDLSSHSNESSPNTFLSPLNAVAMTDMIGFVED